MGRLAGRNKETYILTRSGAKLSVDYTNLDIYVTVLNNGGCWDKAVMDCCNTLLRPGDVFYDIGANAGVFALDFAKAVPNLDVYAFEPQPTLARHLRLSVAENGFDRVRLFEVLLGSSEGTGSLYITSHAVHASTIPREHKFEQIKVPMRTLDALIRQNEVRPPDVIKIDVEGAELDVFKGASHLLHTYRPSIVFEADANMSRQGYSLKDLMALLRAAEDYKFFVVGGDDGISPAGEPYPPGNFLALSPRHIDRFERDRV
jgi:FkbM family methyltransferase